MGRRRSGEGRPGRHHHAGTDRLERLHRDRAGDPGAGAVVQLSAPDDHRRHRHGAPRDAARPRARQVLVLINGKRRHQSALVHLNGSIGRGSTGVDLNAIPVRRSSASRCCATARPRSTGPTPSPASSTSCSRAACRGPTLTTKFGLSTGTLHRQPLHADRPELPAKATTIDFTDGELFDIGGSWGLAARQGQRHDRGGVPASQPHQSRVVRSARPDRRRRCRQQRRRPAESPLGRSRHARPDDLRQRAACRSTAARRGSSTRSAA